MPYSLRVKVKKLRYKGMLTDKECDRLCKALEQQPCEDAISRQAVLERREILKDKQGTGYQAVKTKYIRELPPVTPQPKTGHWIKKDGFGGDTYYDCSECGESWTTIDGTPWDNGMKFCPNCGAKMEVSE